MRSADLPPAGTPPLRWIPPTRLKGAWQMAIDELLLDASVAAGEAAGPVLRLYRWSRPTLSLGYHQRRLEPHWWPLAGEGVIDLVRRPSGGRAVLHDADLTYALIWPSPGVPRTEAYRRACLWLQRAFAALGQPLDFGDRRCSTRVSSCFALATAADLVHGDGSKRIGSAQLWRRGHLLQHGSIQLAPRADLWRRLFGAAAPHLAALPVGPDGLIESLRAAAEAEWGAARTLPLTAGEMAAAAERLGRYRPLAAGGCPSAAESSAGPSMPRAT